MAEKSIDIVAEKIERNDIRRNTSNQIISYTLPDDSVKLYGILRITGQRTAFNPSEFSRVVYSKPSELVNPIPQFAINIVSQTKINTGQLIANVDELFASVRNNNGVMESVMLTANQLESNPLTDLASPITSVSPVRPITFGSTATG